MLKLKDRSMNKKKIKRKKMVITAIPIVILCAVTYTSIISHSQEYETTFAHENYYGDEIQSNDEEYININSDFLGRDSMLIDYKGTKEEEIKVITNHDSVILDTDPESFTVLVNKELSLPTDYVPKDLVVPDVLFDIDYFDEKKQMRSQAAAALENLFHAAEEQELSLYAISGYRSYSRQYEIFTSNIRKKGLIHTMKYSAKPGYSEHQSGLSIDVSTKSINNCLDDSFAETLESKWLADNAHLYGYIIRYPEGKTNITGYSYEPWHIRYVGKSLALYLYENDLVLEEYYRFKPSKDYSSEISYDNLEDFGIDLNDVIEQPVNEIPEKVIEEETIDDEVTTEDEETTKDKSTTEVKDTKTKDKDKTSTKDDTEEESTIEEESTVEEESTEEQTVEEEEEINTETEEATEDSNVGTIDESVIVP